MYLGYLSFAEIEVVNEARTHAYREAMEFPSTCELECETLRTSLEHAPYTTPAADGAPWYDSALPESGDVAGFELLSVTGLGSSLSRGFTATSNGVSIGNINPAPREMVLRFAALAKNKCATDYAIQWLLKTMAGLNCNQPFYPSLPNRPCGGDDMCYFTCCPETPADVDTRLMSIFKVGLTGSAVVADQEIYGCAGHMCEIEVTLASDPYMWRTPFTAFSASVNEMTFRGADQTFFPENCPIPECVIPEPPGCEPIVPLNPEIPPTPCIGGVPFGSQQRLDFNHYTIALDMSGVSKKLLSAPIIRWIPTPDVETDVPIMFGLSRHQCDITDVTVDPCVMEAIYFVPAYQTDQGFVIDTRLSSAYQTTDGCPILVTDLQLAPTAWDRLACAENMCLHIWIDQRTDSRAGQVTMEFATEFTAGC